jgi:hypothetical protein
VERVTVRGDEWQSGREGVNARIDDSKSEGQWRQYSDACGVKQERRERAASERGRPGDLAAASDDDSCGTTVQGCGPRREQESKSQRSVGAPHLWLQTHTHLFSSLDSWILAQATPVSGLADLLILAAGTIEPISITRGLNIKWGHHGQAPKAIGVPERKEQEHAGLVKHPRCSKSKPEEEIRPWMPSTHKPLTLVRTKITKTSASSPQRHVYTGDTHCNSSLRSHPNMLSKVDDSNK